MKDKKDSDILINKVADGVRMEQAHSEMDGPSNEKHWYLARDGKRYGPVGEDDLRRMYAVGKIKPTDHLWRQGFDDWCAASDMSDFFGSGLTGDIDDGPRLVRRAQQAQSLAQAQYDANILRAEPLVDRPELEAGRKHSLSQVSDYTTDLGVSDATDPIFPNLRRYEQKRSLLKTLVYASAILFVFLIGALVTLPIFLPADFARDRIITLVKSETGRDLIVRGETKISAIPNLGLELHDVSLENLAGVAGDPLVRAAVFTVGLKILPLLMGRVEFAQIILKDPVVSLRIDRASRNNWSFRQTLGGRLDGETAVKLANLRPRRGSDRGYTAIVTLPIIGFAGSALAATSEGKVARPYFSPQIPQLGDLRVINGTLTFSDERTSARQKVEDINFSVGLQELAEPIKAEGAFKWRSEKILLKMDVETPDALIEGLPSPLKLTVGARHAAAEFAGNISLANGIVLNGRGEANITSLRSMAEWFGSAIPPGPGFGPMSYRSAIKADGKSISLKNVDITLDGMNAEGDIIADLSKERPLIKAELTVDRLDFNPYMGGAPSIEINRTGLRKAEQNSLTQLIENINIADKKENSGRPEGTRAGSPAAVKDQFVTASLGGRESDFFTAADADIALSVSQIFYEGIKIGKSQLVAKLNEGNLTADIAEAKLYDGTATGKIEIGDGKTAQRFSAVLELKSLSALPFLKDAADFDWISGRGEIVLDIVGVGATKKEILTSLKGRGQFRFVDGALEGFNVPQMVRAFKIGQLSNWSREEKLKTDFSHLSANFMVDKGVANTEDISFKGPLLRISGKGTVDVAKEKLDLRLRPKLIANLDGQTDQKNISGVDFPLRVTGSWNKPNISPDLKGIANDPETVSEAITQAKKALGELKKGRFKEKNFEDLIRNILGNDGGGSQGSLENPPDPPKEPDTGGIDPRALSR